MKTCTKCGLTKSRDEFHKHKGKKDGLQNWCKLCKSELSSKRYTEKTEYLKKQIYTRKNSRRIYIRQLLNRYKSIKGCMYCSERKYWRLAFHHIGEKFFNIADAISCEISLVLIKKELAKCIVVCHNCHADLHHKPNLVSSNLTPATKCKLCIS